MNVKAKEFVEFVEANKHLKTKKEIADKAVERFKLVKHGRAVYYCSSFSVVFSFSKNKSFSNTVVSYKYLRKYDSLPLFVVVVRSANDNDIYLANTSFIQKVSHSSQKLTIDVIRGSINGSDIIKKIDKYDNRPENFDLLYAYHESSNYVENHERIVNNTHGIVPKKVKEVFTEVKRSLLMQSPERAKKFVNSKDFDVLYSDLNERCLRVKDAILIASHVENVNIRGRLIEALITSNDKARTQLLLQISDIEKQIPDYDTKNDLGDYQRTFEDSDTYTDIKTKVLYLDSNPKAYNIDKFLKCMAKDKSVMMFFFVGIDETGNMTCRLCSVFHNELRDNTLIQPHWAGRASRGVAQFNGKTVNCILQNAGFTNKININDSQHFLEKLLAL